MKSSISLFCISLLLFLQYFPFTLAQNLPSNSTQTLFLLEENGKYGLMNEEGKIWLKPKFDEVVYWNYEESASKALYMKGNRRPNHSIPNFDNQFQHLDKNLLFLRRSSYDDIVNYEKGELLAKEGAKCYYLDDKGKPLFEGFYENATLFDKGIAAVQQKGKVGVIDSTGQFIIPPKFREARIIFNGDAIQLEDTLRNLHRVDRMGQIVPYEEVRNKDEYNFLNSHIFLLKDENGKLGLQDTSTQRIIIPPIFDRAKSSRKGTALVLEGKKWKLIDTTGQQVLEETFDRVTDFTRGWAGVWANRMANFINPKGEFLSENWFNEIEVNRFSYPYAAIEAYDCQVFYKADSLRNISTNTSQKSLEVFENCQWKKALIDSIGKIRLTYDELKCCPTKEYPLNTIRRGNLWGIYNKDLEIVIEPQYQQILMTGNNDFHFAQMPDGEKGEKGLWGLIDSQNIFLAKPQFDQISFTSNRKALNIKKKNKSGIMDFKGKIIIPPLYDKIECLCKFYYSPNSSKNYYTAQQGSKTVLFDKNGKMTIRLDNQYESWDFQLAKNLIRVKVNGKSGIVDFQGNWKIKPKYDWLNLLFLQNNDFVEVGEISPHGEILVGLWKHNKKTEKYEELLPSNYNAISQVGKNIILLEQGKNWSYYHLTHQQFLNKKTYNNPQDYYYHKFIEGRLKVCRKEKWGFIDTLGNEVIPLQYKSTSDFHKGFAKVTLEGKTALFDTLGSPINTLSEILFFAHKSPLNRFRYKTKEGLIDLATGKIILPAQYNKIQYQSNRAWHSNRDFIDRRVAKTYKNGKIGLVSFEGKEIVSPIYDHVKEGPPIGYPTWFITKEKKTGLVERNGTLLLEVKYDELKSLKFNELLYRLGGKYGIIRVFDNEMITTQQEKPPILKDHLHFIPPMFDKLSAGKSIVIAQRKGKWGILKREGRYTTAEFAIEPQFEACKIYDSYPFIKSLIGFVGVKKNGKWGLYDENYQLIQSITLDKAPRLIQDYFEIEENGERRILDFYGNLLPKNIRDIQLISKNYSTFQSNSGKWGILQNGTHNQKPTVFHPAEFENIRKDIRHENILYLQKEGIRGFYDLATNNLFLDKKYNQFRLLNNHYVAVYQDKIPNIYDLKQQKIIATQLPYEFLHPSGIEGIVKTSKDYKEGLFNLQLLQEIIPSKYVKINLKNKNKQNHWIVELVKRQAPNTYAVLDAVVGKFLIKPIEGRYFKRENNGNYSIFSNDQYLVFNPNGTILKRKPFKTKFGSPNLQAAQMSDTEKWGFVNTADSLIIPPIFDNVRQTPNQATYFDYLYDVQKDGQWGTIDKLGKAHFPPMPYETMTQFSSNCFRVKYLGKFGLMDSSENTIAKVALEEIKKRTESVLAFRQADKWGFMDYSGNLLLAAQFTDYIPFYDGMAVVQISSEKRGVINQQGEIIIPFIYDKIETGDNNTTLQKAKWIKCHLNNTITYFNTKGKKIFTSNYPETHLISRTLAAVKNSKNNRWGLRNLQTKEWILKPIFDHYQSEGNSIHSFQLPSKMAYINRKGNYIWKEKGFELLESFTK